MSQTISDNKVVTIDYVLRNAAGEELDKSDPDAPMLYLHGGHNIVPGLERQLLGKTIGDEVVAGGAAPLAAAPGGEIVAVHPREGRNDVVALVRLSDGSVVRWIRAARSAAWTPDGRHLAIGGLWGVLLAEALVEG